MKDEREYHYEDIVEEDYHKEFLNVEK